jgi:hypothetical protein
METSATGMLLFQDYEHEHQSNSHAADEVVMAMLQQFTANNPFATTDDFDPLDNGQAAIAVEGPLMVNF